MFPLCLCFICRWFGVRFDGSYRPTQTSASTDADIRIDRRRHPHRPTQTSASTDADVRIDRRGSHKYEKKPSKVGVHLLGLYLLYIKK
ncbi:hypothetical protein [Leyella stercorea]|uniref:hypothetical protein n=1 Tax=Leyella stercorea TaxID=363265 RepID=UPI003AF514FB